MANLLVVQHQKASLENKHPSSIIQVIFKNIDVYTNAITIDFFKAQKFGDEQEEINGIV